MLSSQLPKEVAMPVTKSFWISWYHLSSSDPFEITTPWWISGGDDKGKGICAAIRATSEEEAKQKIMQSYTKQPADLEWFFCVEKPDTWSPFSDRFPRCDWMEWEPATTQ